MPRKYAPRSGEKSDSPLRQMARQLGLSPMTVSRALRGVGHVSPATAARVHEIARKLKYRPNPMVQAFMSSVRRRSVERTGSIAWVLNSTQHKKIAAPLEKVEAGARARAESLGFTLEVIHLPDHPSSSSGIERI